MDKWVGNTILPAFLLQYLGFSVPGPQVDFNFGCHGNGSLGFPVSTWRKNISKPNPCARIALVFILKIIGWHAD